MKTWMKHHLKGDSVIWSIVLILAIISILVVYSATSSLAYRQMQGDTEYYLIKHSLLVVISLLAMWVAHKIDYRYYAGLSKLALWIAVPLLLLTWKYGLRINEASRWITIPLINQTFQSSHVGQLALIVALAHMLAKGQAHIEDWKTSVLPMLIWCGVVGGLIALTNLSGAILLFLTCILLMYIGRVPIKYLLTMTIVGIGLGAIAMHSGQRGETGWSRVKAFIQEDLSFQTEQAYIAIATGGLYGKGPGQSDQRSFLPHSYSDFIYAIILEEYGLLGGAIVILLYLALLYRGMINVSKSHCAFGGLLSAGLSFALVLQAMVHIGVAVGLGPVTGIPLPFISMGGTSLIFTGISLGIMLSVSRGEQDEHSKGRNIPNKKPKNVYRTNR